MTTLWPARRVKDKILCGRQVAGRYVCTGELATVRTTGMLRGVTLPAGVKTGPSILADPNDPYDPQHGIDHVDWTARAKRQMAAGRQPEGHGAVRPGLDRGLPGEVRGRRGWPRPAQMTFEFTRRCPNCHVVGVVDPKRLAPETRSV